MDSRYANVVRLLLAVAPEVFRNGYFAMKGGTAINLFVQDMPRLSVDIDVAYTSWMTPRAEALREISEEIAAISARLGRIGLEAKTIAAIGLGESKLLVQGADAQMKLEINLIFRGTVQPVETRPLAPSAAVKFSAELALPMLAADELYGSKLVAALDRQHPRDLFDVWKMYETRGLTDGTVECFVTYLAGHNRPLHEVLFPRIKDVARDFAATFVGLTTDPIELATLEAARLRLMREVPARLSIDQRAFLLSLARATPDWPRLACAHAQDLPAIRWRLQNLDQFRAKRPQEFEAQASELERLFRG